MIQRLLPHLRHFASIRQALADVRALGNSLTEMLDNTSAGVIQPDREGRIAEAGVHAARLLRGRNGLCDAGGVLRAEMPRDDARLQRVLAEALPALGTLGSAGATTVGRTQSPGRLLVCVTPVSGRESDFHPMRRVAALVLVVDPDRRPAVDPGLVATALDLTPSESRLAVMLAAGHSVRDIAERTNRSENTVRWHLKRIFRKQGFSSQADLVNSVWFGWLPQASRASCGVGREFAPGRRLDAASKRRSTGSATGQFVEFCSFVRFWSRMTRSVSSP